MFSRHVRPLLAIGVLALACAAPAEPIRTTPAPSPAPSPVAAHCEAPEIAWAGTCVDPTGGRSATAAVQAAIDALPAPVGLGTVLELPSNATLRLDDPDGDGVALTIARRVILEGRGARLNVVDGVTAIRLLSEAAWSSVRDLRVVGAGPETTTIGIDVRAHGVRLDNLWLHDLGQGVQARTRIRGASCEEDADCLEGTCREGTCEADRVNVNSQRWSNLLIRRCGSGVYMQGGDANGGLLEGLEVLSTPRAIQDASFLGNVYVAPLIESGLEVSIDVSGIASGSTVLGGYIERGSARAQTAGHTLMVGGNAVSYADGPGERVGFGSSHLRFRDLDTDLVVHIPSGHAAMSWRHPEDPSGWALRRFGGNVGRWGFVAPTGRLFLDPVSPLGTPAVQTTPATTERPAPTPARRTSRP
ncbi:MAG: hypothetical protein KC619_28430 [Myxococcales bacterium]|nr:hypothetical protein [Myxococcales bacterium]